MSTVYAFESRVLNRFQKGTQAARRRGSGAMADSSTPLVSAILTTRDRPRLLSIALNCYARQTYWARELIVIDDGEVFPADAAAVEAVGGRLIRVEPGTLLGTKLNRGV